MDVNDNDTDQHDLTTVSRLSTYLCFTHMRNSEKLILKNEHI